MRVLLLLPILLAACGQRGDLYMPTETPPEAAPPVTAPTAPQPAPTEERKKEQK